ncbi:MAG: type VI secretion system ATPase TssH [Desulfovermiculus sp.]
MIDVDMKSLLAKLNDVCTQVMHDSAGLTVSRTHYEITVEHFLSKCLETTNTDLPLILSRSGLSQGQIQASLNAALEEMQTGNAGKPVFSPMLIELLESAWLISSLDLSEHRIRSGAVLLAFLAKPNYFASTRFGSLFQEVSRPQIQKAFWDLTQGSQENAPTTGPEVSAPDRPRPDQAQGDSALDRFCIDFTANARQDKIDAVFGRDQEIRQIVDILARRRKNNPILVGEPGVGKTAVLEGLALRIIQEDVPAFLRDVRLLGLDMGALEAGAGMKGEFENRLRGVIQEIQASSQPIILFIDEAHTLIGSGGASGSSDAANLLKPALARGELKTCAATTWKEYKKYFEKDPALERRFQMVKLDPPSVHTTSLILRGLRQAYEQSHQVIIRDDAIVAAAEYADRYIAGRFLPDKAIDLLDTACARVKVNLDTKPARLEDMEREIQALDREKQALLRDQGNNVPIDQEQLDTVCTRMEELQTMVEELSADWIRQREAASQVLEVRDRIAQTPQEKLEQVRAELSRLDASLAELQGEDPLVEIEVAPDLVGQVISDWTGIPVGKLARDQARTVLHLAENLQERIKGQDQALEAIADVIKEAKSGIRDIRQPLGVFLLAGPSGVGKTETGLALADLLFGSEKSIVTINMSEFQEKHTVSRLIGSPPGYVGYGEGGLLTEAVRQHPYTVVLLDEVEKAHPDVMNIFYQVFDKGVLTDGEGKEIDFANTILILTSNLGSDVIQEMTSTEDPPDDAVLGAVRPLLSQHFKPALLARMTVVPYYSLKNEALQEIVRLKLNRLGRQLADNNHMAFSCHEAVVQTIAQRCTETETGARNIDFILRGNLLPQMSRDILSRMTDQDMPQAVHVTVDDQGSFQMEYSFQAQQDETPLQEAAGGAQESGV